MLYMLNIKCSCVYKWVYLVFSSVVFSVSIMDMLMLIFVFGIFPTIKQHKYILQNINKLFRKRHAECMSLNLFKLFKSCKYTDEKENSYIPH